MKIIEWVIPISDFRLTKCQNSDIRYGYGMKIGITLGRMRAKQSGGVSNRERTDKKHAEFPICPGSNYGVERTGLQLVCKL